MTDHAEDIKRLRLLPPMGLLAMTAAENALMGVDDDDVSEDYSRMLNTLVSEIITANACAAALLEVHDATGISLDNWHGVREFVESRIGHPITENGV